MIFQQYSNYNLGGVYTGRRSLTPEQIWLQTAYLHPPETDENYSCLRVCILHCLAWVEAYVSPPHQWVFVRNFSFLNPLSTASMVQVQLSHPPLLYERRNKRSSDATVKGCGKIEGLQKENHPPWGCKSATKLHWETLRETLFDMQSNQRASSACRENWKWEIGTEKVPHTLCSWKNCFLCLSAPDPEKGEYFLMHSILTSSCYPSSSE